MSISTLRDIDYPESDGKPMAETPLHMLVMWNTIQTLIDWYADDPKVYVWGNMMLYYVEGDIKKTVAPDVFVVKGVDKHKERRVFKTWEEKTPKLVIEVTSRKTRKEDLGSKKDKYQNDLKVPEYFLFDPKGSWIKTKLRGFRLKDGEYQDIEPMDGRLPSKVLGLHLEAVGDELRLWDPKTQKYLLTPDEQLAKARRELGDTLVGMRAQQERLVSEMQKQRAGDRAEVEQLRQEVEALKQQAKKGNVQQ
jgi:Uma2 family endonuclease